MGTGPEQPQGAVWAGPQESHVWRVLLSPVDSGQERLLPHVGAGPPSSQACAILGERVRPGHRWALWRRVVVRGRGSWPAGPEVLDLRAEVLGGLREPGIRGLNGRLALRGCLLPSVFICCKFVWSCLFKFVSRITL